LEPIVVETTARTLVIGGGVAGLRAAIGLADIGIGVFLVEREVELGGWVGRFNTLYPNGRDGRALVSELIEAVRQRPAIRVFTDAVVFSKSGTFGNYQVGVRVGGERPEELSLDVGSIVVTTGVETYAPVVGEYGYGIDGVLTLPEFKALVDGHDGPLLHEGRPVHSVVYVYCVGSRQHAGEPAAREYCSRFCCAATVATSVQVARRAGAFVIGTSSRADKLAKARELGMDVGIDYTTEDVVERVLEATGGHGVDVVFEHVGGDFFQKALDSLAKDGRLVTCGGHGGEVVPFDIIPFFRRQLSVIGSFVFDRREVETCFGLVARGELVPQVAATFPLEEAAAAMDLMESREFFGKIVLTTGGAT